MGWSSMRLQRSGCRRKNFLAAANVCDRVSACPITRISSSRAKIFAQAARENGLRIGHYHTDKIAVAIALVRDLQVVYAHRECLPSVPLQRPTCARIDTHQ